MRANANRKDLSYHFAPNGKHRAQVTPAKRGKASQKGSRVIEARTPAQQRAAMTWAQRLKRVFGIDMVNCECGGTIKIIACIEDPVVIKKILDHLKKSDSNDRTKTQKPNCKSQSSRSPHDRKNNSQLALALD